MADRYWVGGTASWDGTAGTKWATTSGGTGGASVPTTADDVIFDSGSGAVTCTIATGNTGAKSINCTGFTGTITGSAGITVAGSITLVAGQTYTHTGVVTLTGTGTLTTAGKTFGAVTVNGSGITVTLGDALTTSSSRNITISSGTFDTANYNVTCATFEFTGSNVRTLTLGSSTVTISKNFTISGTNLTFNVGTSQINLTGLNAVLSGGAQTFYNVSFSGGATRTITDENTFNDLTSTGSAVGLSQLSLAANQTVNGTFTCAGSSASQRGFVFSNTTGTTRTITANAISANDCDFRDITLAGTAAGASPTRAGDCGNNSGITFPAAKTVYWNLAGTQNWNATAWATTSNGTPAANNFPLAQDTATFTNDGAAGTIRFNSTFNTGTIDASGRTSAMTLNHNAAHNIYGSYTLGSGVTISDTQTQTFAGRGTQTFTSAGKTITFPITVDKPAGAFELGDATTTTNTITLTRGTFDAKNYNLTCTTFTSSNSNTRTITMGSGLWTLSGTGTLWNLATTTGLTFNQNTANILLSDTSTTSRTFAGGNVTYNKLTIGGTTGTSTLTINGSNTISELASTKTVAHTINFNDTRTITTWSVTGTAGNVVTVGSAATGVSRTVTITNRTVDIDYLSVKDINSTNLNPVTFYAGANSTNGGNNTGVAFIARTTASPQNAHILTSGTTFTVPSDWNSSNNNIYMIGAGGGGALGQVSGNTRAAGGGGGGGAFTQLTNFTATPSSSVTYAIGTSGNGVDGGNTTWSSGTYIANGGLKGTASTTGPTSAGGTGGTAQTVSGIITAAFAGGNGGAGAFGTAASTGYGSGAGGGAGGPNGVGGNGGTGFGSSTQANVAGGGGGGNGGGSNGGNAASATFGAGGNNFNGIGGGATAGAVGTFGGGGAGGVNNGIGGNGGSGIDILNTLGGSGGRGGAANAESLTNTSLYGGGGSGGSVSTGGLNRFGSAGSQGVIFIVYTPSGAVVNTSNFFFFM